MRCNICDKELTEKEISYNEDLEGFEPCTECLDIAFEAAFSGGVPDDDREFAAVDSSFDDLDNESFSSFFRRELSETSHD